MSQPGWENDCWQLFIQQTLDGQSLKLKQSVCGVCVEMGLLALIAQVLPSGALEMAGHWGAVCITPCP